MNDPEEEADEITIQPGRGWQTLDGLDIINNSDKTYIVRVYEPSPIQ